VRVVGGKDWWGNSVVVERANVDAARRVQRRDRDSQWARSTACVVGLQRATMADGRGVLVWGKEWAAMAMGCTDFRGGRGGDGR